MVEPPPGLATPEAEPPLRSPLLYATVLVIATCGLTYELVAGTLASYVLGDSITQFSTVIGCYLSALGVGSYLSKFIQRRLSHRFVEIELAVGLIGGCSAPLLFLVFGNWPGAFRLWLYGLVALIGILVGLEIPLILRILEKAVKFRDLVAQVLTFDYLGALVASLLFPLLFVPHLGLIRTSLLFGLANALVGLWSTWLLPALRDASFLRVRAVAVIVLLTLAYSQAGRMTTLAEDQLHDDTIVHAQTSRYQRIVMTQAGPRFSLFLNGNLQFASVDEYRYHEALVHPLLGNLPRIRRVLVLGGGDGLAVREILRYDEVEEIVLVDLDPAITELARQNLLLRRLNEDALHSPRVTVINADAFTWIAEEKSLFDAAIVDFPDPSSFSLGKLYTRRFYRQLEKRLDPAGGAAIQCTSPLFARRSFWCIQETLESAGFGVHPFHAAVPSFGEWGFSLALKSGEADPMTRRRPLPDGLRFLDGDTLPSLFVFGPDLAPVPVDVNRLNDQLLVRYYTDDWESLG
ncbi:MAG: polyamine aminopropyltransferase [Acidobacteriota bacterium]